MKPIHSTYGTVISLENLYRAANATLARGRRFYGEGAWFSFHLEREVSALHRDLAAGVYCHGRYQIFQIWDPKPRTIAAAGFRDRVLHHAVHDILEPRLDPMFIYDSYACREGKGTHRALDRAHRFLRGNAYFVHLDVQRYFQSIDHGLLKGLLRRYVADVDLLMLLDQIIDSTRYLAETAYEDRGGRRITRSGDGQADLFAERPEAAHKGLPLGNLTSQLFANLYLNAVDQFVKHRLKVRRYVRYMDDMALFAGDKATLHAYENAIRDFAGQHLRLALHPSGGPKLARRGLSFLGFRLFPTHRRLKKTSIGRFIRRMNEFEGVYATCENQAGRAALRETIQRSVQSFDAHARHGNTFGLRRRLYDRFPLVDQPALGIREPKVPDGTACHCRKDVRVMPMDRSKSEQVSERPAVHSGYRIETRSLDILEGLIETALLPGGKEKSAQLRGINVQLEQLRFLIRMAKDGRYISHRAYEYGMGRLLEVGKMLGGWINAV